MQYFDNLPSDQDPGFPHKTSRIIRRHQVQDLTGLKKSHIYAMAKAGKFPRQIKLSDKAVGWVEKEVASWLDGRIDASRLSGGEV